MNLTNVLIEVPLLQSSDPCLAKEEPMRSRCSNTGDRAGSKMILMGPELPGLN